MLFNKKFQHPIIPSARVCRALDARYHSIWEYKCQCGWAPGFAVTLHSWMTRQTKLCQFSSTTYCFSFPLFIYLTVPLQCLVMMEFVSSLSYKNATLICSQIPICCWVQLKLQGHHSQTPTAVLLAWVNGGWGLFWCLMHHDYTKLSLGFWWDDLCGMKNISLCAKSNKSFPYLLIKQS